MIDPRERYSDPEETLRAAWDGFRSGLWTSMPGIIQSFDATKLTAVVQPAIQGRIENSDGTFTSVNLPLLYDVPVVFPRGGGCTLTFPITPADEVLIIWSSRCLDAWWMLGGVQVSMDPRMHDLSDAFCIPGPFSQKTKISNVSTSTVQLRSNDGATYVELDPTGQVVHVKAPGGMTIDANVTINGNVQLNGDETATGTIKGQTDVVGGSTNISLKSHVHKNVQPGTGLSGGPQ